MNFLRILKRLAVTGFCLFLLGIGLIWYANRKVQSFQAETVQSLDQLRPQRAAVVFGCNRYAYGHRNQFYEARLDACHKLYNSGKVQKVLVSGDNGRKEYSEPDDMKADLMKRGIPEEDVICDYAGFSTLDTVVRAKKVFGLDQFIAVSQEFQCVRAAYIGEAHGIEITAYCAGDVSGALAKKTYVREYLARVKAWLDVEILRRGPKFLGPRIEV